VLFEVLRKHAVPKALHSEDDEVVHLARVYKEINAPLGALSRASLNISTKALASGDATNDAKYAAGEAFLAKVTDARDHLAEQIKSALDAAEFHGTPIDKKKARAWANEGDALVDLVEAFDASF
jgi:hypothetical protein